jgi:hypothetical protein
MVTVSTRGPPDQDAGVVVGLMTTAAGGARRAVDAPDQVGGPAPMVTSSPPRQLPPFAEPLGQQPIVGSCSDAAPFGGAAAAAADGDAVAGMPSMRLARRRSCR